MVLSKIIGYAIPMAAIVMSPVLGSLITKSEWDQFRRGDFDTIPREKQLQILELKHKWYCDRCAKRAKTVNCALCLQKRDREYERISPSSSVVSSPIPSRPPSPLPKPVDAAAATAADANPGASTIDSLGEGRDSVAKSSHEMPKPPSGELISFVERPFFNALPRQDSANDIHYELVDIDSRATEEWKIRQMVLVGVMRGTNPTSHPISEIDALKHVETLVSDKLYHHWTVDLLQQQLQDAKQRAEYLDFQVEQIRRHDDTSGPHGGNNESQQSQMVDTDCENKLTRLAALEQLKGSIKSLATSVNKPEGEIKIDGWDLWFIQLEMKLEDEAAVRVKQHNHRLKQVDYIGGMVDDGPHADGGNYTTILDAANEIKRQLTRRTAPSPVTDIFTLADIRDIIKDMKREK